VEAQVTFSYRLSPTGPVAAAFGEQDKFPKFFEPLITRLKSLDIFSKVPFQVSVNMYDTVECSLEAHKDSCGDQVVILSFGTPIMLDFYYSQTLVYMLGLFVNEMPKPTTSLLLQPGSLLLLRGNSFHKFMHGIAEREKDIVDTSVANYKLAKVDLGQVLTRGKRISLLLWTN